MLTFDTQRLLFVPCSLSLAKSFILYEEQFQRFSPVLIPDGFPTDRTKGLLPLIVESYEQNGNQPGCRLLWFIVEKETNQFIGELESEGDFKTSKGVNFSLRMLDEHTEWEYQGEALHGFLNYHHKNGFRIKLSTEVPYKERRYKRLLEESGFKVFKQEGEFYLLSKEEG